MNAPFVPSKHSFSGEEILRMQGAGLLLEGGRFELINGEIIDMPAEGGAHLRLKVALNKWLIQHSPDTVGVVPEGTLRLDDRVWPEPDFYLYAASMTPDEVRGPQTLLVIEIADATLEYDMGVKATLYRQYGVREYWVINLNARETIVHRADDAWPMARRVPFGEDLAAQGLSLPPLRLSNFYAA